MHDSRKVKRRLVLRTFIRKLMEHGDVLTLDELYSRDQSESNGIILGIISRVCVMTKIRDRKLLVMHIYEVNVDCKIGKQFAFYAYNEYASALVDTDLQNGDYVSIRSPTIEENTRYQGGVCTHGLQARVGLPSCTATKIFFLRRHLSVNCGSSINMEMIDFDREATPNTLVRCPSPCLTETSFNSLSLSPVRCPSDVSSTIVSVIPCASDTSHPRATITPSTRTSPRATLCPRATSSRSKTHSNPIRTYPPPGTSSSTNPAIPNTSAGTPPPQSTVAVRLSSRIVYKYKTISECVVPENKINVFGVISSIVQLPTDNLKHGIIRLRDHTCGPSQELRVHIFCKYDQSFPKLEHGCILRLHRLKTEVYDNVLDGRVFRGSDVVTFPAEGHEAEGSSSTAKTYNFCDADAERLIVLRRWIKSDQERQAAACPSTTVLPTSVPQSPPAVKLALPTTLATHTLQSVTTSSLPTTTDCVEATVVVRSDGVITDCPSISTPRMAYMLHSTENVQPAKTLLREIKKEGNYNLVCKVLEIEILSEDILILTVTDGTVCTYMLCFGNDSESQQRKYATLRVRILVLDPTILMKRLQADDAVELINVKVVLTLLPVSKYKGPILSFKMNGIDCSVNVLKGIEPEAVRLRERIQNAQHIQEHHTDLLITNLGSEPLKRQDIENCASLPSTSSSISHAYRIDNVRKCLHKGIENRSSNQVPETETPVSRPVSNVSRKRHLFHETKPERGHKSRRTREVEGTQSDEASEDVGESNQSGRLSRVNQPHSGSESQRQEISEQLDSHSNNSEQAHTKPLSNTNKLDKNYLLSSHLAERQNTEPVSTSVLEKQHGPKMTEDKRESSMSRQQSSDNVSMSQTVPLATTDLHVTPQKLQRNKFPISPPGTKAVISSKRDLTVWLTDLNKTVAERHCTSVEDHDALGQVSNLQYEKTWSSTKTSANPDRLSSQFEDSVDHLMRNMPETYNAVTTEYTNSVSSPVILDALYRLATIGPSQHSSGVSTVSLLAQEENNNKEIAASQAKLSGVKESVYRIGNDSPFRILSAENIRRDESGGCNDNVAHSSVQENNCQNSYDCALVVKNSNTSSVEHDTQQSELITDLCTYDSHPIQQSHLSSNVRPRNYVEDEQHPPGVGKGPQPNIEGEQCLPPPTSVAEVVEENQELVAEKVIINMPQVLCSISEKDSESAGNIMHGTTTVQRDAGDTLHEKDAQGSSEESNKTYIRFADTIETGIESRCSRDGEVSDTMSVVSEIVPASEADDMEPCEKFAVLSQACSRCGIQSHVHDAETLSFSSYNTPPVSTDEGASELTVVERNIISGDGRRNVSIGKSMDEEEPMEVSTDVAVEHEETFASAIITIPGVIPANISYIKRNRVRKHQYVYSLKAWLKDIEPPVHDNAETNIVTGYCECCKHMATYGALVMQGESHQPLCGNCFQEGKKRPVQLEFLLRLHLVDDNDDELIATVSCHHGIELLGCTVNAYLRDSMTRGRIRQMLTNLIEKGKNVNLQNRGPILKLLIVPVRTSKGIEYLIHNTYFLSQ